MTAQGPSQPIDKPTLTDYLRVRTRFLIDPIADLLARLRLSPDLLTVVGMLSHFLFAWLIAIGQMQWAAVAIFILSPLDALDGAVARRLGRKQHGFGAFLDSTLDRIAEIVLFGGFIAYYGLQRDATMLAVAYVAISGSLMVSYSRARAEGLGFSAKIGLLGRVERYVLLMITLIFNQPDWGVIILAIMTYFTVLQRAFHVWRQAASQP